MGPHPFAQEPLPPRADAAETTQPAKRLDLRDAGGPGLGTVWVAFAVAAALALALWALKRWGARARAGAAPPRLRVLERRPLSPRQDLWLVEVGPRILLIGSTRDRLATLGEFDASLAPPSPRRRAPRDPSARTSASPESPSRNAATDPEVDRLADELATVRHAIERWDPDVHVARPAGAREEEPR